MAIEDQQRVMRYDRTDSSQNSKLIFYERMFIGSCKKLKHINTLVVNTNYIVVSVLVMLLALTGALYITVQNCIFRAPPIF